MEMEIGLLEYQFWIIKLIKVIYFCGWWTYYEGDFLEHIFGSFFE
jgi:hypothetical protein